MELLYFFEKLRTPLLNDIMSYITLLGGGGFFIVAAIVVYWCFSKKCGYYMMTMGFTGTILNQFLKLLCRVPRPWVLDPDFTIVENARSGATGYSFPSGHTQNAFTCFGAPARYSKSAVLRIIFGLMIVLIAVSRMYLGVHTPLDVGVSIIIGLILMFVLYPVFRDMDEKPGRVYIMFSLFIAAAAALVLFVEFYNFPADIDMVNYEEGLGNSYMILCCSVALLLVFHLDHKYLHFQTQAVWWAQLLKLGVGLAITLYIKSALKEPLALLFGGHAIASGVRYFIVIIFACIIWPLTFNFFAKLGRK